ncbi:MAG: MFS transporter, partial [Chloroflexi bacterium]|nr:MFS transporter [Chloroflexota bacterium]
GSRALMVGGAVLAGVSLIALAFISEPWHFYALRGVVFPLGVTGMSGIVATTAVANWFVRQRGSAIAAASLGLSVANIVFPPLATALIQNAGWRADWAALGVLVMLLVVPAAALLMKRRPEDLGLLPDGDLPGQPPPPATGARTARSAAAEVSFTRAEAVRTRALWLIVGSFTLANMGLSAMAVHLIPYFKSRGLTASEAA